jgi:LuxR family transcriptional regulator, positive regulator of biofilm formation
MAINHNLTKRERELLSHVAAGMTDKQVAEAMCVTPLTVKQHLHNIYGKLDLASGDCNPRVTASVWLVLRERERA